jgi:hypothetical protein
MRKAGEREESFDYDGDVSDPYNKWLLGALSRKEEARRMALQASEVDGSASHNGGRLLPGEGKTLST